MGSKRKQALRLVHPHCAGIDVGKAAHYVAVPECADEHPVRSFASFTDELHAMAAWLKSCALAWNECDRFRLESVSRSTRRRRDREPAIEWASCRFGFALAVHNGGTVLLPEVVAPSSGRVVRRGQPVLRLQPDAEAEADEQAEQDGARQAEPEPP